MGSSVRDLPSLVAPWASVLDVSAAKEVLLHLRLHEATKHLRDPVGLLLHDRRCARSLQRGSQMLFAGSSPSEKRAGASYRSQCCCPWRWPSDPSEGSTSMTCADPWVFPVPRLGRYAIYPQFYGNARRCASRDKRHVLASSLVR